MTLYHGASVAIVRTEYSLGLDAVADSVDLRELRFNTFEELLIADFGIAVQVDATDERYQLVLGHQSAHVTQETTQVPRVQVTVTPVIDHLIRRLNVEVVLTLQKTLYVLHLYLQLNFSEQQCCECLFDPYRQQIILLNSERGPLRDISPEHCIFAWQEYLEETTAKKSIK